MRGLLFFLLFTFVWAEVIGPPLDGADQCPGYNAVNIDEHDNTLTADLVLANDACNLYGDDLVDLKLLVEYQTGQYTSTFHPKHEATSY